jgi:hypothetical protein
MKIHNSNTSNSHALRPKNLLDLANWLAEKIQAHHCKKTLQLQVHHLRNLDHYMRLDMGIDEGALFAKNPKIDHADYSGSMVVDEQQSAGPTGNLMH